jgi:hypothetical protein
MIVIYTTQQKKSSTKPRVQELLSKISREDYQALDKLFYCLMFENYFAYTLFGTKPITYHGAFYDQPTATIERPNSAIIFLTNWKVWEKYAKHSEFQTKNFIFLEEKRPELFGVYFINKKNVLQCVKENIEIFKCVLGKEITPEKVLQLLIESKDIYEPLKDNHILYGILFGFGAENATAFYQKFELALPLPDPTPFHNEDPKISLLPLPYFMTFHPNSDTERLRKLYTEERKHILSTYEQGNFLEITFNQLLKD